MNREQRIERRVTATTMRAAGCTYREIAAKLGCSPQQAWNLAKLPPAEPSRALPPGTNMRKLVEVNARRVDEHAAAVARAVAAGMGAKR